MKQKSYWGIILFYVLVIITYFLLTQYGFDENVVKGIHIAYGILAGTLISSIYKKIDTEKFSTYLGIEIILEFILFCLCIFAIVSQNMNLDLLKKIFG